MNFLLTKHFKKQLKKYLQKDRSLIANLETALNVFNARFSVSIGKGVYKIRVRAQNKGKSGGYRVYLLLIEIKNSIIPLCIYSKNDKDNLSSSELKQHLSATMDELSNY